MDTAIAAARAVAAGWQTEAEKRRRISKHDLIAETLDYCAGELLEKMRPLDAPGAMRTVEQYATDHGVTAACVRKWLATGRLDGMKTPHGWRIQREATVRGKDRRNG